MPKIFLSAGHSTSDPGALGNNTSEHLEVQKAVESAAIRFASTGVEMIVPPENLNLVQKIAWINAQATPEDFALEIHLDAGSPTANGSSIWYEEGKNEEKSIAEYFASALSVRLGTKNRGAQPDTTNRHGRLGFVRDTICPAWLFECGFITNISDLSRFQQKGGNALYDSAVDLFLGGNPLLDPAKAWPFRDVFPAHFAFESIKKAKNKGILADHPEFRPNDAIARGEMMILFERLGLLDSNV